MKTKIAIVLTSILILAGASAQTIRISQAGFILFQDRSFDDPKIALAFRTFYRVPLATQPQLYVTSDGINRYRVTRDEIYSTGWIGDWNLWIAQNPHDRRWCICSFPYTYYTSPALIGHHWKSVYRGFPNAMNPPPTSRWLNRFQ